MGLIPITTNLEKYYTLPKIELAKPVGSLTTDPNTQVSNPGTNDNIINPNTQIPIPNSNITIPNIQLDNNNPSDNIQPINNEIIKSNLENNITTLTTKIEKNNLTGVTVPNSEIKKSNIDNNIETPKFTLFKTKSKGITIPDTKLSVIQTADKSIPELKTTNKGLDNNITIPKLNIVNTLSGVSIPNIRLDNNLPNDNVNIPNNIINPSIGNITIPNIITGIPSTDNITIPDTNIIPSIGNVIIPNIILDNIQGGVINPETVLSPAGNTINNITNPDISIFPSAGGVTIPNIDIFNSIGNTISPGTDINKIPFIDLPKTFYNTKQGFPTELQNPLQLPVDRFSEDIISTIYKKGINLSSNTPLFTGGYSNTSDIAAVLNPYSIITDTSGNSFKFIHNYKKDNSFYGSRNFNTFLDNLYKNNSLGGSSATIKNIFNNNQIISVPGYYDLPNSENSGEPFILRRIGQHWGGDNFSKGFDWFSMTLDRAAMDVVRYAKFNLTSRGKMHLINQLGMQMTNPKVDKAGIFRPTRIFNPLSPILQLGVAPLGGHWNRHGILPIDGAGSIFDGNYEDVTNFHNNSINWDTPIIERLPFAVPGGNRLLRIWKELNGVSNNYIQPYAELAIKTGDSPLSPWQFGAFTLFDSNIRHIKEEFNFQTIDGIYSERVPYNNLGRGGKVINEISDLIGGPKSVFGIGSTLIRTHKKQNIDLRWTDNTGKLQDMVSAYRPTFGNTYLEVLKKSEDTSGMGMFVQIVDSTFRLKPEVDKFGIYEYIYKQSENPLFDDLGNLRAEIENTTEKIDKISDPIGYIRDRENTKLPLAAMTLVGGRRKAKKSNDDSEEKYKTNKIYGYWPDMVGRVGVQDGENKDLIMKTLSLSETTAPPKSGDQKGRDFIKVRIHNLNKGMTVAFRAYISSMRDNISPDWAPTKYIGRADDVYSYIGFKRTFSYSLLLAAESTETLNGVIDRINYLIQSCSPDNLSNGLLKGPLSMITVGDYIKNEPVIITSLTINIDDEYPWDIEEELPMYVKVDLDFTLLGKSSPTSGREYISEQLSFNKNL